MREQPVQIVQADRNNSDDLNRFLNLPLALYGDTPAVRNSIQKTRNLLKTTSGHDLYIAYDSRGIPAGRMSVGINKNIRGDDGLPFGQIGLFEVIEDYAIFSSMIQFARNILEGCGSILFPIYNSTWYPYRFASSGRERFNFFLETIDMPWYSEFTERSGIKDSYSYKSIITDNIRAVIDKNRKYYDQSVERGFTFRKFEKTRAGIDEIYDISIEAFRDNNFYSEISREDFHGLYSGSLKMIDDEFFTLAVNRNGETAGFCFSTPDYTPVYNRYRLDSFSGKLKFFLNRNRAAGLIIKTAGILPQFRGAGLQGALTYLHASSALKRNYKYIIGALIYSGSVSPKVLGGDVIEKEYKLYRI